LCPVMLLNEECHYWWKEMLRVAAIGYACTVTTPHSMGGVSLAPPHDLLTHRPLRMRRDCTLVNDSKSEVGWGMAWQQARHSA
ncbi:hypothetical protein SK128_023419, partial [Halocaridina rubra]